VADSILVNGNLHTMDAALPSAQALAVKDGNILQVGSDESIRALAGENTKIFDANGRTITPGMIDAHNHLQVYGSLQERFVQLMPPEVNTLDGVIAGIKTAVDQVNPGEWVQALFWDTDPLPTKYHLDPVSPENPVWLIQQGGHYGVANSKALEIAGITPETQNPVGGIIERDASGELTGMFYNHKAMDLLRMHAPMPSEQEIISYIKYAGDLFATAGVTSFQDVNVRYNALEPYVQAHAQGQLIPRAQIFYTLEWPADLERALNEMPSIKNDFMQFTGYKFLIDGQFPTWYTHEPHPGISWDMPTWEPQMFKEAVKQLHDTGLQIAIHCGGDAAVDLTLEAYEEAKCQPAPRPAPPHRARRADQTPRYPENGRPGGVGVVPAAVPALRGLRW
jgi:hypothetical protein